MKPTWGTISSEGCKLFSCIFDTVGFFARHVDDLKLMAGSFRIRDDSIPMPINVKESRFGVIKTAQWEHAQSGTKEALARATCILREAGARVEEIELPSEFSNLH